MVTKSKQLKNAPQKFDYRTIKTFEDACSKAGVDPGSLPETSLIPDEFKKPLIAYYKLLIVFKVINNGWRPDWNDPEQYKYYPWFWVLSSGFDFSDSDCNYSLTNAYVGSRLCVESSEKALYITEQFKDLYRDYLLYSE